MHEDLRKRPTADAICKADFSLKAHLVRAPDDSHGVEICWIRRSGHYEHQSAMDLYKIIQVLVEERNDALFKVKGMIEQVERMVGENEFIKSKLAYWSRIAIEQMSKVEQLKADNEDAMR